LSAGPLACNRNGRIAHIYDKGCDKGSTLQALLDQQRYRDLAPADVLAIGDGINDRPMIDGRHGFTAATVANAEPDVKSWVRTAGGMIADRERGAGVAQILADVLAS
jgi:hydroxymethylpyrimidine pyrophosphatase-like HAD family hydrolase